MAEADTLQTRKAHLTQDDDLATAVPTTGSHSRTDQYPNPFQQQHQHIGQGNGGNHHQQQQHYNLMIPTVDHWPAIFLEGLKTSAQFAVLGLQKAHAKYQEYQASRSGSYQILPTTNLDTHSYPQQTSTRQTFRFGSKRQQKGGHQVTCSGRRLTRSVFFLVMMVTVLLFIIPHRLNPLEDRAIWVRYYSHEEAIKITIPFGYKPHVSDVKKQALKDLQNGYSNFHPGNVKLISRYKGALSPDQVWDNSDNDFRSSAKHPILAVDTKYELFKFLDSALGCFATQREYSQRGRSQYDVSFDPGYRGYFILANIIDKIANEDYYFDEWDIKYLRNGFDDPKKNEPITGTVWKKGHYNRDMYIVPDSPMIPHEAFRPWDQPSPIENSTFFSDEILE